MQKKRKKTEKKSRRENELSKRMANQMQKEADPVFDKTAGNVKGGTRYAFEDKSSRQRPRPRR